MRIIALVSVVLTLAFSPVHAQLRVPLKITVDKDQKTQQEVKRQAQARQTGNVIVHTPQVTERSREVVMNIKLQNLGGRDLSGLLVKYTLFGRDKTTRAIRPAVQGESTISLKPLEAKTVKTEPVEFDSVDVAFTHGIGAEFNRTAGKEYYGIAVTVFVGDEKVASHFNPAAVEKELEKLQQEAAPEKPDK